jgi:signal transduction histidine kinase
MGRLFWKIYLWFWLTLLLIITSVFIGTSLYLQNQNDDERRRIRPHFQIQAIIQVLRFSGEDAARAYLQERNKRAARRSVYVLDESNIDILGRKVAPKLLESKSSRQTITPTGKKYRVLSDSRRLKRSNNRASSTIRFLNRIVKQVGFLWLGIAFVLSSIVCFWLAWYLTRPIRKLQNAVQEFSRGKLDTRVSQYIGSRRDEIADLGRDFDNMAEQLQKLINNQKQLLSDVSHELRSPLARLQVAVGLAGKKGNKEIQADLLRIEQESERLDDLIGQSLTLSRLDAGADYPKDDYIEVAILLKNIISDCNFEASSYHKHVSFGYKQSWTIKANAELLRRALENVIRNAIHYTTENTTVEVTLDKNTHGEMIIQVCDQGVGVPETKLAELFEPFVRLSSSRNRDSGGYGLGLAIAKRAITFHQGKIKARNRRSQGLCVEIILPIVNM